MKPILPRVNTCHRLQLKQRLQVRQHFQWIRQGLLDLVGQFYDTLDRRLRLIRRYRLMGSKMVLFLSFILTDSVTKPNLARLYFIYLD